MSYVGLVYLLFLIIDLVYSVQSKDVVYELKPNKIKRGLTIYEDHLNFFKVNKADLLPNQYYKVMVHFLGSVYTITNFLSLGLTLKSNFYVIKAIKISTQYQTISKP